MPVELSIVIINWNGGPLLQRCIESIVQSPPKVTYEIIVVDNSSTDDSLNWLRSNLAATEFDGITIRLFENRDNLGFAKANNQAISYSDAPLLLLLNNDTEVRPGAIDLLVTTLESEERIAACGPRLINPDGSLQVSAWRNPPTAWVTLISGLRLYRLIPGSIRGELLLGRHWDHARRRKVGMLSAAALLIRRRVIDEVGGFDERFHMYAEDDELCLRVVRAHWWLVFEPNAVVMHRAGGAALSRWSSLERNLRIIDEGLRFQRHSLSRVHFVSNLLANAFVLLLARIWRRLSGGSITETRRKFDLYMKYLREALRHQ